MIINKFAVSIAKREGKIKQMNIAQIKEVIKCVREELIEKGQPDIYKMVRSI